MDFISRPDAIETPATSAYKQGKQDFAAGEQRQTGSTKFYGSMLFSWIQGWDDAEEEYADCLKTEAEWILPLVAVGTED